MSEDASRSLSHSILVARSRGVGIEPADDLDGAAIEAPAVPPDQGHDSSLLSARGGWRDDEWFVELRARPTFHGLMDGDGGHSEHMQIGFLDTRVRI